MVKDFGKRALSGRVHHVIKYVILTRTRPFELQQAICADQDHQIKFLRQSY